jgi:hypothetical protein
VRAKPGVETKVWIQFALAVAFLLLFLLFPTFAKRLKPLAEVVPKAENPSYGSDPPAASLQRYSRVFAVNCAAD